MNAFRRDLRRFWTKRALVLLSPDGCPCEFVIPAQAGIHVLRFFAFFTCGFPLARE